MSETKVTSWRELRLALGKRLKATGNQGFEGLLARLFTAETEQPFYLARTGDQPAGDAYGPVAGVSIQAKRYTVAKIDENNVEGDIDRALRETPATDIFVVAATRTDNQLKLRLEKKTAETGVDLLLFALDDALSPLGALCVTHWDIVREFLPNLDVSSDKWVETQQRSPETPVALAQLQAELSGLPTYKMISELAQEKLKARFEGGVLGTHAHNRVVIADGIARPTQQQALQDWWRNNSKPMAVIEGEEGTGKTWIAADFASGFSGKTSVVLWLDSLAWFAAKTVEEVVRTCLENLFPPGDKRAARVLQKVFRRWRDPVLLVLDGANERGAMEAAERILYDYDQHRADLCGRVRILFTSRPSSHYSHAGRNSWGCAKIIPVGPFSDAEFASVMEKFAPDVSADTLTDAVRELARVPRYFRLCLELRRKLASFTHLNREILLWADLEAKLDRHDPQWFGVQEELDATPSEMLAHLASQLGWPTGDVASVANTEMERHLPGFHDVRADLREQRIVLSGNLSETKLSAEHLILGWALVLLRVAEMYRDEDSDALCDRLQRLLEPAASNDDKARAVHVAALLAFFSPSAAAGSTRAALLRLWTLHHNSNITEEALEFFVGQDLAAYLSAVETLFRVHLPGNFETTLIAPLSALSRDGGTRVIVLRQALERWLRFIFPGDASGSKTGDRTPPSKFIAAKTAEQLRLSYAAAGIISFRPEIDLLPALIDCFQSDKFCYADTPHPEVVARWRVKSSSESVGLLARWHYGEAALPVLDKLGAGMQPESDEWKNLHWFARQWRAAHLPASLGSAQDIHSRDPADDAASFAYFRKHLSGLSTTETDLLGMPDYARLAVRRDLPELTGDEIVRLSAEADSRLDLANRTGFVGTLEQHGLFNLLPYLARYSHNSFTRVVCALWKASLNSSETCRLILEFDECLPATDEGGRLVATINARLTDLFKQPNAEFAISRLTEVMLFHADANSLLTWLRSMASRSLSGSNSPLVSVLPLPIAFSELAPEGFDVTVRAECDEALRDLEKVPTAEARCRVRHWLQIYAHVVARPSPELGAWALDLADHYGADEGFHFPLFRIVSRCADLEILRRALQNPAFAEHQLGFNSWRWGQAFSNGPSLPFTWAELKTCTSYTVSGWLLKRSGRDDEMRAWGYDLANAALNAISAESLPPPQTRMEVHIGRGDRLEGTSFESPPDGHDRWMSTANPAWGVDRQNQCPAPSQGDLDRLCDSFHSDLEARSASARREFVEFNAAGPLCDWSRIAPKEFSNWAEEFLKRVAVAPLSVKAEMAYFIDTVAMALLRVNPNVFFRISRDWSGEPHIHIMCCGGAVTSRIKTLWEPELNDSSEVVAERDRLLLAAPNDEEILWHVLAAHFSGNGAIIASLATDWLHDKGARERALGVTLLAFHGDAKRLPELATLSKGDPSFWVREHARWAWDVCSSESAARQRYSELLTAGSLEEVAAGFPEEQGQSHRARIGLVRGVVSSKSKNKVGFRSFQA